MPGQIREQAVGGFGRRSGLLRLDATNDPPRLVADNAALVDHDDAVNVLNSRAPMRSGWPDSDRHTLGIERVAYPPTAHGHPMIVDDQHPTFLKVGVRALAFPVGEGRRIVGRQIGNK